MNVCKLLHKQPALDLIRSGRKNLCPCLVRAVFGVLNFMVNANHRGPWAF